LAIRPAKISKTSSRSSRNALGISWPMFDPQCC
jgi:hypothetical protein